MSVPASAANSWPERAARARELASRYPANAQILKFYEKIAAWQGELFGRIAVDVAAEFSSLPAIDTAALQSLLDLVAAIGPKPLAEAAGESSSRDPLWRTLLANCWSGIADLQDRRVFFAHAFLQPYAERVRLKMPPASEINTSVCPYCAHRPVAAVLREMGMGGKRFLLCSLCLGEWEFRRLLCPSCGEEDPARLPVYSTEEFPHIRVEACESCRRYVKSVDLTKDGRAVPLVDETATAALDLWVQEQGYAKLSPNLMGM